VCSPDGYADIYQLLKGIMGKEGFKGISQYFELRFLENWTDDNTCKKGDVVNGQEQEIIIKIQGNKIALEYESTAGQSLGKGISRTYAFSV